MWFYRSTMKIPWSVRAGFKENGNRMDIYTQNLKEKAESFWTQ